MTERLSPTMAGLAELMRAQVEPVDPAHDAAERDRLMKALMRRKKARAGWPRRARAPELRWVGALAAAAALAVGLFVLWPEASIDYQVSGATLAEGGYLRAESGEAMVSFSEGSSVALARGSVARIVEVSPHGARLVLEAGGATLDIEHRDEAAWSVAAGPFVVDVTGTHFAVEWNPSEQVLDVRLDQGAVVVRGPMLADGLRLREGQKLSADLDERRVQLADFSEQPTASASAPAGEFAPAPAASHPAEPVSPPSATAVATPRVSWAQLVAEGEFDRVIREAQARGVGSVLSSASLEELVALSDAARYVGRSDLARSALLSVRDRFGSSGAARTAAFLLGRLAEGGSGSGALDWYDRYLAEAPRGTFASEALGRKMMLLRAGSPAKARAVARQYLQAFPKGGYAQVARDLLGR